MSDEPTKKWWQSITIDAAAIVFVLNILALFGVNVSKLTPEAENIAGVITSIITLIGTVFVIIGRIKATKQIE